MAAPKRDTKGRFPKGASGNPKGRPTAAQSFSRRYPHLAENGPAIIAVAISQALDGDRDALGLLVPRLVPALRPVDVPVALAAGPDSIKAADEIVRAVMAGEIPPDVAERLVGTIRGAVAIRTGSEGQTDEARGRALRELRELMLGTSAVPDVDLPSADNPYVPQSATGGEADADA